MADYAIHDTTLEAIADVIRKKEGSSALIDPAEYAERINLMGMLEEKTIVSSPIADFSDGADDVPTKSLVVTIPPTLSGVSSVTETQTGRNLINISDSAEITRNQLNANVAPIFNAFLQGKTGGYTISGKTVQTVSGDANFISIRISYTDGTQSENVLIYRGDGHSSGGISGNFYITSNTAKTIDSVVFGGNTGTAKCGFENWQLEIGSTAHAYEPYQTPTQYTASLGRTIYGGEVDIVNGEGADGYSKDSMSSTYLSGLSSSYIGYEASTNYFGGHPTIWVRNWNYQTAKIRQAGGIGCVCNYFPVSMHNTDIINTQNRIYFDVNGKGISDVLGFIAFVQNLEANNESLDIVYELETATDFTFDGQEIPTRLGYNAFWSDSGDTSVAYRASGTIYQYPRGEEASF